MLYVIELLESRNHYLKKFSLLNEEELARLVVGNYGNIDTFYQTRENILRLIGHIETLIENELNATSTLSRDEDVKKKVQGALKTRGNLVNEILDQDLEIISMIEVAKTKIIKELQTVRTHRRAVGSYRSGDKSHSLDEEV